MRTALVWLMLLVTIAAPFAHAVAAIPASPFSRCQQIVTDDSSPAPGDRRADARSHALLPADPAEAGDMAGSDIAAGPRCSTMPAGLPVAALVTAPTALPSRLPLPSLPALRGSGGDPDLPPPRL